MTTVQVRELPAHVVVCTDCGDTAECDAHLGKNVACGRCAHTGSFVTAMVNGKPSGPGGICFRCNGKGFHTARDRQRNNGYERFGRRF